MFEVGKNYSAGPGCVVFKVLTVGTQKVFVKVCDLSEREMTVDLSAASRYKEVKEPRCVKARYAVVIESDGDLKLAGYTYESEQAVRQAYINSSVNVIDVVKVEYTEKT